MKTFADRAKSINDKYKYADNVSSDREARDGELMQLFQEQEQMKQSMQMQQQGNQFPTGGSDYNNTFKSNPFSSWRQENQVPQWKDFDPMGYDDYDLGKVFGGYNETGMQFGENTLAGYDKIPETQFEEFTPDSTNFFSRAINNTEAYDDYLRVAAGVAAGATNLINRGNVKDPELIKPEKVNPTFKYRGLDLEPYKSALANELASTNYSFMRSGADFDTAAGGVNATNQRFAGALGKMEVEQQRINSAEGARGDAIINANQERYASSMNQAQIFRAQRQDVADQSKRDYIAALGRNISGMLQDESDKAYSKELEPFMRQLAELKGYATKTT